ncbi:MAG: FkbM family methyltransferase [Chitinophagaceae bacterium]|nr:MAG: FkbM family methyltransferase [Chitinophagaceae bacterium]
MNRLKEQLKLLYRAWKYRYRADGAEIGWMLSVLKPGAVCLDIGAHKGAYTFWMKRAVGGTGKVVAFEPQQEGAALLRLLYQGPVRVEQLGLSDKAGRQTFFIHPQANAVSYEASLTSKYADAIEQVIETTTLDAYCAQQGLQPDLLKIDVEGHELEVLRGGTETLRHQRPSVLIEIERRHIGWERMRELFAFFEGLSYKGSFFAGGSRLPLERFDPDVHQDESRLAGNQQQYINNFIFEPIP